MEKVQHELIVMDGETKAYDWFSEQSFGTFRKGDVLKLAAWEDEVLIKEVQHLLAEYKGLDARTIVQHTTILFT